jgi:quinol monooxygenase YgiN
MAIGVFCVAALLLPAVTLAQGQGRQGPALTLQGPASTVAYVDILPASRAQAIEAFRRYREASRLEAGFVAIDVFEQLRRGAYFVLIETWASAATLEAHSLAPHTSALLTTMRQLAISGYDQRPYGALTVSPARPSNPQAVYVVTHVDTITAQGSDPSGMLKALAEKSRTDVGNLRFDVLQHAMRRNHFTVVESWESPAAADAHLAAAHTKQYRLDILPLSGSPLDERLFRAVE